MNIFILQSDVDNYKWFTINDESDFDLLFTMRGQSYKSMWKVIPIKEIVSESGELLMKIGDYPKFDEPLVSRKAMESLKPHLGDSVEFLEVNAARHGVFYIMNVTKIIDCLDLEKSKIKYHDSSTNIMHIEQYVFKEKKLINEKTFRIKGYEKQIYVTDNFRELIDNYRLEGFTFTNTKDNFENPFAFLFEK